MAWLGMQKNKRFYLPYLLTCIGMVMMYYIVSFLSTSVVLGSVLGGEVMQSMLALGQLIIGLFSLFFLFYTNSFLIKRRKKEFGLYNILGMGKRNLAHILFWESIMIALISMTGGLIAGIAFSKFAELGMVNILKTAISFSLKIDFGAVLKTIKIFGIIFFLLLFYSLYQIHLSNPIELFHSESAGEKPPRANWFLAFLGVITLGVAYYLALTIKSPVEAFVWFFAAVALVIIATYFLFIAGSVAICRILQKNKNYYYKTSHFVSVASMVYRMKRNGAGLASICILCTMVLVMLSGTVCLYIGTEDSLRTRYPRDINLDVSINSMEQLESHELESLRQLAGNVVNNYGKTMENVLDYRAVTFSGYFKNGKLQLEDSGLYAFQISAVADIWEIFFVPLEDYNRLTGQQETLKSKEAFLYTTKSKYKGDSITIPNGDIIKVKKNLSSFAESGRGAMEILPSMYVIMSSADIYKIWKPLAKQKDKRNKNNLLEFHWIYGFDVEIDDKQQIQIQEQLQEDLKQFQDLEQLQGNLEQFQEIEQLQEDLEQFQEIEQFQEDLEQFQGDLEKLPETGQNGIFQKFWCEGIAKERTGFYGLYGGLFFLGILLGVVFLFAAVLIMYYKQVSEGYEDQSRFEIMRKVGMTKKDIKKSVNSQVLTVFFLPLLMAGLHLLFAFPMIYKLLILFSLTNKKLLILVTICCFLIFALFYIIVYRITSKAYYMIVSNKK